MLNAMASADFETSAKRHAVWGLRWMDLKDSVYGMPISELSCDDARRVASVLQRHRLEAYCFSTVLLGGDVTAGERAFATAHIADLTHLLELAAIIRPRYIRLLAAQLAGRDHATDAVEVIERLYPFVIPTYQAAIDQIASAGFAATIENEASECVLSTTREFRSFFAAIDRPGSVGLTWDPQNQWATGVVPTVEIYEHLRDLIVYYHVKGGRTEGNGRDLAWDVALDEATWPVVDVTRRIIDDGVSPVICLNPPSHGRRIEGYAYGDAVTERDISFLRSRVSGVR